MRYAHVDNLENCQVGGDERALRLWYLEDFFGVSGGCFSQFIQSDTSELGDFLSYRKKESWFIPFSPDILGGKPRAVSFEKNPIQVCPFRDFTQFMRVRKGNWSSDRYVKLRLDTLLSHFSAS